MEDDEELAIPGHVSSKRAARMLGISDERVKQFIRAKRLSAQKISGRYMIPIKAVEDFRRSARGRARTEPPQWRVYDRGIQLKGKGIQVQIRPGQEAVFEQKLRTMREEERHLLRGTMLRYVLVDEDEPGMVHIWLAWKDNERPDEEEWERELAEFRADFADVLDWTTERASRLRGLVYT